MKNEAKPDIKKMVRCLEAIMEKRGMTVKVRERGKT